MPSLRTDSLWGHNQLGMFQNGTTDKGFPDNLNAIGVLNQDPGTGKSTVYLFDMYRPMFAAKHLPTHIGLNGVTETTPVFDNSTQERIGTVKQVLALFERTTKQLEAIEAKGYEIDFDSDDIESPYWRVKHTSSAGRQPDTDDHEFIGLQNRSLIPITQTVAKALGIP